MPRHFGQGPRQHRGRFQGLRRQARDENTVRDRASEVNDGTWWWKLWRDERGDVGISGVILLYAILVLGVITGLVVLRNSIVQEFGDMAVALRHLDQSYTFVINGTTHQYVDMETTLLNDPVGLPPAGIGLEEPPATQNVDPGEN